MFCPELLRGFWSDQSETYTDWICVGWNCTPPLGGDFGPFVCLWEVSEIRSPQHFTNQSDFSYALSWTCPGVLVGSILNLYRFNIYGLELSTSPWGRRRTFRFSVRGVGTWFWNYFRWAIIQESCLITRKPLLIDVLSFLDLYYIDLSWKAIVFMWAIIQESCLITRKPLLIDVLSYLDLYYIDLSWFRNYFRWAVLQESLSNH